MRSTNSLLRLTTMARCAHSSVIRPCIHSFYRSFPSIKRHLWNNLNGCQARHICDWSFTVYSRKSRRRVCADKELAGVHVIFRVELKHHSETMLL